MWPSKATPASAITKFAASGKYASKKDLGMMAMTYENVYVAQIASGANQMQTIKDFEEAEKFPGPSIIIAYTPCITHRLAGGMSQTLKEAKERFIQVTGLYIAIIHYCEKKQRTNNIGFGKTRFFINKKVYAPTSSLSSLESSQPDTAELLFNKTINDAKRRFYNYARLAGQEEKI